MMSRKWIAAVILLTFGIIGFLYSINAFNRFTHLAYDLLIRSVFPESAKNVDVVLVTATENFVSEIGHEPNRFDYAKLLYLLGESELVVSDIFFPSLQSEEMDNNLRKALVACSDKIILPVFTPYKLDKNRAFETGYVVSTLNENHPYFQKAVKYIGHINVFPDSDTIVRKCPAFIFFKGQSYPHVVIKALSIHKKNGHINVSRFSGFRKLQDTIPVDRDGCFAIRYVSPSNLVNAIYTMEDVLKGKVSPETFKGKIVIIGHTIMGSKNADLIPTPLGVQFGALVQMQVLYTVFSGNYIWTIDQKIVLLFTFFIIFIIMFAFFSSFWRGTRSFVFCVLALLYSVFILFKNNVFFDPVPGLFASVFAYASFVVMNFFEARKEISKGHQLLSVLETTQREIASIVKPQEMPGMQKRVYLPTIHDTFFYRTPAITLKTINSLLGISDGVVFSHDKSTGNINILVNIEGSSINKEMISAALKTIQNDRVRIFNRHLPEELRRHGLSNMLVLQILEEPMMNIYGIFVNKKPGPVSSAVAFTKNDYQWIASFCLQIVVAVFNTQLNDALKKSQLETIMRLATAIEYRDRETGMHIARVSEYCALIATEINLPKIEVELIKSAVPLHDLGKIAIPDSVLLKPSALTDEEKEIIKSHTIIAAKMLEGSDSFILQAAYLIALYHHEKFDGTGYPYGLKGNAIPLYGRIASLADVFDALSSKRVYKEAVSFESSIQKIIELAGKDFDPQIVDAFVKNKELAFEIYTKYQENLQ
ncbi:MAG TPA: CHASE2 domain-containing protein [bacterium]|nr:CHASE2 domain-containing protein [bacterium]